MIDSQLRRRLDQIERRILRLEQRAGLAAEEAPKAPPEPAAVAPVAPGSQAGSRLAIGSHDPTSAPGAANATSALSFNRMVAPGAEASTASAAPPAGAGPTATLTPGFHEPAPWRLHDRARLEKLVGGRLFAAAGGLIVALGLAFFMKLAYDEGWLGAIPPAMRCLAGAVAGMALLLAGAWARKRAGVWAAAGLSSAGVATLYISAFIAYGVFGLLTAPVAFGALVLIAVIGVAVAARAGARPVAVLSAIGACLAPLLTATDANPVALPMYLTALLAGGLYLSVRRGEVFRALRPLCWTATMLMGGLWGLVQGSTMQAALAVFVGAVWALTHAELLLASRTPAEGDEAHDVSRPLPWRSARPPLMSILTTAWAAALGIGAGSASAGWMPDWFLAAALIPATFALASMTAGTLRILRDPPLTAEQRLGASLMVQAGALLAVVVALGLAGWLEVVAWLSLGLAGAAAGRWLRAPSLAIAGAVALLIATLRLFAYDAWQPALSTGHHFAGLALSRWALVMALASVAWLGHAWACSAAGWRLAARAGAGLALGVAMAAVVHADSQVLSIAAVWVALGAVIVTIGRLRHRPLMAWTGLVPAALGAAVMLGAATHWAREPGRMIAGFTLTPWTWTILGTAALFAGGAIALISWRALRPAALGASIAAVILLAIAPAHEASELISLIWHWIALTALLLFAGRFERRLPVTALGLGVLGLAAAGWSGAHIRGAGSVPAIAGLSVGLIQAVAIAAVAIRGAASLPRSPLWRPVKQAAMAFAGALLFVATSFEATRLAHLAFDDVMAQRATISLWWAIYAGMLLILGSLRRWPACRFAGLGLLATAGVKVVTFDLVAVDPGWRVASMVGVGLMMLAVAVGYGRIASARPSRPGASDANPDAAA
jgi:uncharacterized membrane protein